MAITNDVLKEVMTDAIVYRGYAKTMNVLTSGIYEVNSATEDIPDGVFKYGILKVSKTPHYCEHVYTPLTKLSSEVKPYILRRTIEGNFVNVWGWFKYFAT